MKKSSMEKAKVAALEAAAVQFPDATEYSLCLTEGEMMVYVHAVDGSAQLHSVGVKCS